MNKIPYAQTYVEEAELDQIKDNCVEDFCSYFNISRGSEVDCLEDKIQEFLQNGFDAIFFMSDESFEWQTKHLESVRESMEFTLRGSFTDTTKIEETNDFTIPAETKSLDDISKFIPYSGMTVDVADIADIRENCASDFLLFTKLAHGVDLTELRHLFIKNGIDSCSIKSKTESNRDRFRNNNAEYKRRTLTMEKSLELAREDYSEYELKLFKNNIATEMEDEVATVAMRIMEDKANAGYNKRGDVNGNDIAKMHANCSRDFKEYIKIQPEKISGTDLVNNFINYGIGSCTPVAGAGLTQESAERHYRITRDIITEIVNKIADSAKSTSKKQEEEVTSSVDTVEEESSSFQEEPVEDFNSDTSEDTCDDTPAESDYADTQDADYLKQLKGCIKNKDLLALTDNCVEEFSKFADAEKDSVVKGLRRKIERFIESKNLDAYYVKNIVSASDRWENAQVKHAKSFIRAELLNNFLEEWSDDLYSIDGSESTDSLALSFKDLASELNTMSFYLGTQRMDIFRTFFKCIEYGGSKYIIGPGLVQYKLEGDMLVPCDDVGLNYGEFKGDSDLRNKIYVFYPDGVCADYESVLNSKHIDTCVGKFTSSDSDGIFMTFDQFAKDVLGLTTDYDIVEYADWFIKNLPGNMLDVPDYSVAAFALFYGLDRIFPGELALPEISGTLDESDLTNLELFKDFEGTTGSWHLWYGYPYMELSSKRVLVLDSTQERFVFDDDHLVNVTDYKNYPELEKYKDMQFVVKDCYFGFGSEADETVTEYLLNHVDVIMKAAMDGIVTSSSVEDIGYHNNQEYEYGSNEGEHVSVEDSVDYGVKSALESVSIDFNNDDSVGVSTFDHTMDVTPLKDEQDETLQSLGYDFIPDLSGIPGFNENSLNKPEPYNSDDSSTHEYDASIASEDVESLIEEAEKTIDYIIEKIKIEFDYIVDNIADKNSPGFDVIKNAYTEYVEVLIESLETIKSIAGSSTSSKSEKIEGVIKDAIENDERIPILTSLFRDCDVFREIKLHFVGMDPRDLTVFTSKWVDACR